MSERSELDGYELAYSSESFGGEGSFGVKVFVLRPAATRERIAALPDPRGSVDLTPAERERLLLLDVGDEAMRLLRVQARRLDPAVAERAADTRAHFVAAFVAAGLAPAFAEESPNGYWRDNSPEAVGRPWFVITTTIGHVLVGWRKRVIAIDWTRSTVTATAEQLFPAEDVTKDGRLIHAWSYADATRYLATLRDAAIEARP